MHKSCVYIAVTGRHVYVDSARCEFTMSLVNASVCAMIPSFCYCRNVLVSNNDVCSLRTILHLFVGRLCEKFCFLETPQLI